MQVAQHLKAEVGIILAPNFSSDSRTSQIYISVRDSNDEKALLSSDADIEHDHVILSSQSSPRNLVNRLGAKGIDVILTYHTGDRVQDYTCCLANFGRLVEVGDIEMTRTSQTLASLSRHRASFFSFDLKTIHLERPHIITE